MVIRGDVLDLTDMQRRGLLKKAETLKKQDESVKTDSGGYVDFSSFGQQSQISTVNEPAPRYSSDTSMSSYASDSSVPSISDGAGALGFLDALANSVPAPSVSGSSYGSSSVSGTDNVEIQGLKNKIEDLEYKLDRLMEKIAKLERN